MWIKITVYCWWQVSLIFVFCTMLHYGTTTSLVIVMFFNKLKNIPHVNPCSSDTIGVSGSTTCEHCSLNSESSRGSLTCWIRYLLHRGNVPMSMFLYAYVGLFSNFSFILKSLKQYCLKSPWSGRIRAPTPDLLLRSQEPNHYTIKATFEGCGNI